MTTTFLLIFIYLEDPCLCQGLDGIQDTKASNLDKVPIQDSPSNGLETLKTRLHNEVLAFRLAHEDHTQ